MLPWLFTSFCMVSGYMWGMGNGDIILWEDTCLSRPEKQPKMYLALSSFCYLTRYRMYTSSLTFHKLLKHFTFLYISPFLHLLRNWVGCWVVSPGTKLKHPPFHGKKHTQKNPACTPFFIYHISKLSRIRMDLLCSGSGFGCDGP